MIVYFDIISAIFVILNFLKTYRLFSTNNARNQNVVTGKKVRFIAVSRFKPEKKKETLYLLLGPSVSFILFCLISVLCHKMSFTA